MGLLFASLITNSLETTGLILRLCLEASIDNIAIMVELKLGIDVTWPTLEPCMIVTTIIGVLNSLISLLPVFAWLRLDHEFSALTMH